MERKTICDGLRKHFWSAASASAHLRLLPLLVAACCTWLPAAQAEGPGNTAEPSTPNAVDAALAEAGLLDEEVQPLGEPVDAPWAAPSGESARYEVAPETGLASWYGPGFHRRKTASGERFDMHAMTAAHPTLAFGTFICVRSQITGRGVVVRVNDRGPHARGRIVDLSRAAAIALGLHGLGLKPVEVFPVANGESTCPEE